MKSVDVERGDAIAPEAPDPATRPRSRRTPRPWSPRAQAILQHGWDRCERWLFQLGNRALAVALALVVFGIVVNAVVAFVSIQTISDRDAWVVHTHAVLAQISTVQTDLLDAQTGARGYVITGAPSYLGPYTSAVVAVDNDLHTLQMLTVDNPTQQQRVASLKAQLPPELTELQAWIALRVAGRVSDATARVAAGVDHRQMLAIRAVLRDMQATENTLLHSRAAQAQAAVRAAVISVTLAVIADLALLVAVYVALRQALRLRERAIAEHAQSEARARLLALEETNRRMEEFLGVAGHELRTPITSALANVQIAARQLARLRDGAGPANTDQFGRLLASTEGQLRRQSRLVDDLLDVTRIENGRLEFRPEETDLVAIVRRAVEEQQRVRTDRRIALRLPADLGAAPIVADPDRIGQVLTNYLTNALKYSPTEALVAVELTLAGGTARVDVRDRGPGLPSAERERVWDRFHRVDGIEVQSGSGVGLGLGLFISKSFIDRHGGSVGVDARADGPGSDFWFTLPLAPEAQTSDAPCPCEEAERATPQP
jgi:signal transduction histidine kinase